MFDIGAFHTLFQAFVHLLLIARTRTFLYSKNAYQNRVNFRETSQSPQIMLYTSKLFVSIPHRIFLYFPQTRFRFPLPKFFSQKAKFDTPRKTSYSFDFFQEKTFKTTIFHILIFDSLPSPPNPIVTYHHRLSASQHSTTQKTPRFCSSKNKTRKLRAAVVLLLLIPCRCVAGEIRVLVAMARRCGGYFRNSLR